MHNAIHVIYGDKPLTMVKELLQAMNLHRDIDPGLRVALKPNLVVARPAHEGATTSPLIAEAIIQYLLDHGHKNIAIMEGSWVGDRTARAFKVCGYEDLARRYHIALIDLQKDRSEPVAAAGLTLHVCREALAADYLINLPVLKAHCQTLYTGALKNLKGCIPDSEKRRYHTLGLHQPIACLASALRPRLHIVDALNGDLSFEEGGNPVRMDRIIAGKDPVLVDTYCASLIGYTADDIAYIRLAQELGVGTADLAQAEIIEYNNDLKTAPAFTPTKKAASLARSVQQKDACSACFGSLIHALNRIQEKRPVPKLTKPIVIGQGFKNVKADAIGIGNCASGCSSYVKGCPPKAIDIVNELMRP